MVRTEDVENEVDKVLVCLEEYVLDNIRIISWTHDIVTLLNKGIEVYRVITHGVVKSRLLTQDFIAISYVAHVSEGELSVVETTLMLSNGRTYSVRPEVDLEKCLKSIRRSL